MRTRCRKNKKLTDAWVNRGKNPFTKFTITSHVGELRDINWFKTSQTWTFYPRTVWKLLMFWVQLMIVWLV